MFVVELGDAGEIVTPEATGLEFWTVIIFESTSTLWAAPSNTVTFAYQFCPFCVFAEVIDVWFSSAGCSTPSANHWMVYGNAGSFSGSE